MKLAGIDEATQGTFFRCLHDEKPEDPRAIGLRHRWYDRYKEKGLRAKVLMRDDDEIVGLGQYIPIEHSHLIGEDLFAILCIWVHGYEHLVGNWQGASICSVLPRWRLSTLRQRGRMNNDAESQVRLSSPRRAAGNRMTARLK